MSPGPALSVCGMGGSPQIESVWLLGPYLLDGGEGSPHRIVTRFSIEHGQRLHRQASVSGKVIPHTHASGSHGHWLTCRVLRPPRGPEAGDGEQAALCQVPGEIPAHTKCEIQRLPSIFIIDVRHKVDDLLAGV